MPLHLHLTALHAVQEGVRSVPDGGSGGARAMTTDVEFADCDASGIRSNALEFSRASRMARALVPCCL